MDGLQHLRFIAFALAGSDILAEVDQAGCVTFCAGNTARLLGVKSTALEGTTFVNLFPIEERPTVGEMMARLTAGDRVSGMRLTLQRPDGSRIAVCAAGMTAMKGGGAMQIVLRRRDGGSPAVICDEPANATQLAALVGERIAEAELIGEPCVLTVLQLPDGPTAGLLPQALARLRAWTLWGASLLPVAGPAVALVHDGRLSFDRLQGRLAELTGTDARCLGTMALDSNPALAELQAALQLELDRLAQGKPMAAMLLSQALRHAARAAAAPIVALRAAIGRSDITLLFQPVADLRRWTVHHYEALARIGKGEDLQLPDRFLRNAAERGLAADLDLTVCRTVMRALDDGAALPATAHVSINISAAALATPGFPDALLGLLGSAPRMLHRVLIEVGGLDRSSNLANTAAVVRQIRRMGCRITLDDLLSGGPDLIAVQNLQPDFVKLDATRLADALQGRAGVALIRAVAQLCDDLGVGSIAKMVEEERLVRTLCDLSVDLAQGYYFARPKPAFPTGFTPTPPSFALPPAVPSKAVAAARATILPPMAFGRHTLAKPEDMAHRRRP